jgi:hypothetical protein
MKPSPEKPQTINAQLRLLPAYQAMLAPAPVAEATSSTAGRVVAGLMQVKDTVPILLLLGKGSLLPGFIFALGIPGLVLYWLRWRQVWGRAGRGAVVTQAALSLLHELFWVCVFYSAEVWTDGPAFFEALAIFYGLGALLSLVQLVVAMSDQEYGASLPDEQPAPQA